MVRCIYNWSDHVYLMLYVYCCLIIHVSFPRVSIQPTWFGCVILSGNRRLLMLRNNCGAFFSIQYIFVEVRIAKYSDNITSPLLDRLGIGTSFVRFGSWNSYFVFVQVLYFVSRIQTTDDSVCWFLEFENNTVWFNTYMVLFLVPRPYTLFPLVPLETKYFQAIQFGE